MDVFLASHSDWFGLESKRQRQLQGRVSPNPFIDPEGYVAFLDRAEERFRMRLAEQQAR